MVCAQCLCTCIDVIIDVCKLIMTNDVKRWCMLDHSNDDISDCISIATPLSAPCVLCALMIWVNLIFFTYLSGSAGLLAV